MSETSDSPRSAWRRLLRDAGLLAAVFGLFVLVIAVVSGRPAVEKFVTMLAMPLGLIWLALTLVCLQSGRPWRRPAALLAALAWCAVSTLGSQHVSHALFRALEHDYLDINPFAEAPFDAIVLLGGGCRVGSNSQVAVNPSGDRVVVAARMYHLGLTPTIICTGERIEGLKRSGPGQGEQSETILLGLGVPRNAIERVGGINTAAEMRVLAEYLPEGQRIGLITSAWHLPRATRLARSAGLDFVPLPANLRSGSASDGPPRFGAVMLSIIPQADALSATTAALKELLAMAVGR